MSEQGAAPVKRGFDLTVNLGHVIAIGTIVFGLAGSYYVNGLRLDILEKKTDQIAAKLDGLATAEWRLRELERRLEFVERR